jgi:uncharacterized protein
MIELIKDNEEELKSICKKSFVKALFLFGSAVRGNFSESSDLDFAVLFFENLDPVQHGEAFFDLKRDLEQLFERSVDLISYRVIKNPIFKNEIDETKVLLFAA